MIAYILVEKPEEKIPLEDLGVDGRIYRIGTSGGLL
jgi:hypothetical protein